MHYINFIIIIIIRSSSNAVVSPATVLFYCCWHQRNAFDNENKHLHTRSSSLSQCGQTRQVSSSLCSLKSDVSENSGEFFQLLAYKASIKPSAESRPIVYANS